MNILDQKLFDEVQANEEKKRNQHYYQSQLDIVPNKSKYGHSIVLSSDDGKTKYLNINSDSAPLIIAKIKAIIKANKL